jgi:hypothetical protein
MSPSEEITPQKVTSFSNLSEGALINDGGIGSSLAPQIPSFLLFRKGSNVYFPLKSVLTMRSHFHFFVSFRTLYFILDCLTQITRRSLLLLVNF